MDHVIQIGEGKTTLFKASELLEVTSKPFDYARQAARNNLALSNRSDGALDQFDHSFKEMMAARVDVNMDKAQKCEEDCLRHLGRNHLLYKTTLHSAPPYKPIPLLNTSL